MQLSQFALMPYKNYEDRLACRRRHYARNRQKYIDKSQERKMSIRSWLAEYKASLKCSRCAENHPACLHFHHRDPSSKLFGIGEALHKRHSIVAIREEIGKCEVLCANCHAKEHWRIKRSAIKEDS